MVKSFGANVNFLKFLNLVRTDSILKQALANKDYSAIHSFPGLDDDERDVLKTIDWKNYKTDITDQDITKFDSKNATTLGTVCESKIDGNRAQSKCYKT